MVQKKLSGFEDYEVSLVSGGNLLREKPVFCNSGKSIIVSNKETLYLYNTDTGECQKQFSPCFNSIVNIQIENNENSLWVFMENGVCSRFNLETDQIEESYVIQLSADILNDKKTSKFLADESHSDWTNDDSIKFYHFVRYQKDFYASWASSDEIFAHGDHFVASNDKLVLEPKFAQRKIKKCPRNFAISRNVKLSIIDNGVNLFQLTTKVFRDHYIGKNIDVTCIEFHPVDQCFATGDSIGRIILWRNIFDKFPLKQVLHWHQLPVNFTFTGTGAHIFSGGEENVLVKWSLQSQQNTFLPRLSAAIMHISVSSDSSLISVSLADSRILIINPNLRCITTIQHFSSWSALGLGKPASILTREPRTDSLVIAGRTGHLQFCGSDDGRFLYTLDVTNRNYITRHRDAKSPMSNCEVRFAGFTRSSHWLVTVQSECAESRVKFWLFDDLHQQYKLNTDIEVEYEVLALDVSAHDELVAITSLDNKFTLWTTVEAAHPTKVNVSWMELASKGYRKMPINACLNFSRDASLLGVGFGPTLTLWDTSVTTLKASLTPLSTHENSIKHIKFGCQDASHLIVTGTDREITCWNIVTLSMQWIAPLHLSLLVNDLDTPYMAAFSNNTFFIFHPASSNPEFQKEKVSDVIAGYFFSKPNACQPYLFFLNKDQKLFCFGKKNTQTFETIDFKTVTPFAATLPEKSQVDVVPSERSFLNTQNIKDDESISTIYTAAPHTLPNTHFLCKPFLRSLLKVVPDSYMRAINTDQSEEHIVVKSTKDVSINDASLNDLVDKLFVLNTATTS